MLGGFECIRNISSLEKYILIMYNVYIVHYEYNYCHLAWTLVYAEPETVRPANNYVDLQSLSSNNLYVCCGGRLEEPQTSESCCLQSSREPPWCQRTRIERCKQEICQPGLGLH